MSNSYLGATSEQEKRGCIISDLVNEAIPYARHRIKPFLTGFSERKRILDGMVALSDNRKKNALRRQFSRLDRVLSDQQAAILDRAFMAWLTLNASSRSIDPSGVFVQGGSGDQAPIKASDLMEAHKYQEMRKHLDRIWRERLEGLCHMLAPWREERGRKLDENEIELIVNLAKQIISAYQKTC